MTGFEELAQLKADHDVFRMQLDVVDAALDLGPRGSSVLRDLTRELVAKLRDHTRRESRLAVTVSRRLVRIDAGQLAKFAIEHEVALEMLRVIRRSLPAYGEIPLQHIRPALRMLVSTLRRHMDDQERLLFPMLREEFHAMDAELAVQPARRTARPMAAALARSFGLLSSS